MSLAAGKTRRRRPTLTMKPKKASSNRQSQLKAEEERAFAQMIPAYGFYGRSHSSGLLRVDVNTLTPLSPRRPAR